METRNTPKLVILVGAPNSGKSTFTEKYLKRNPNTVVISRDNLLMNVGKAKYNLDGYNEIWDRLTKDDNDFINNKLIKDFSDAQNMDRNIIIDMTNLKKKSRKRFISKLNKNKNYEIYIYVFTTPLKELFKRNKKRLNKLNKFIDEEVIKDMYYSFEDPSFEEDKRITKIEYID